MRHRFHWLLAVAASALLLACGGSPPSPAADGAPLPPPAGPADLPSLEAFIRDGLSVPAESRASLRDALGDRDSIASEVIPNRHVPGVVDTLFTVYYPGLEVHIHRPGPGGELLSSVDVASNRYLHYPVIGAAGSAIEEAFGAPDDRAPGTLTYLCTTCIAGDNPVHIFLENGRVAGVQFNYYVD